MHKAVRIVLDHDDDADQAMTLDLILLSDRSIRKGMPFCGWWGKLKGEDICPIIVLPDGRVDYGSDENTDQTKRFGEINLHSKKIDLGEYVTHFSREDREETLFRITRIIDLLE